MRIQVIAGAAIFIATGCSAELTERPAASDPTNANAAEAPFHTPPRYQPDPLSSLAPPPSPEAPPTGTEQEHSPTTAPSGNPPLREAPGGKPAHHHHPGAPQPAPVPQGGEP